MKNVIPLYKFPAEEPVTLIDSKKVSVANARVFLKAGHIPENAIRLSATSNE
jgi:hypothetical protein